MTERMAGTGSWAGGWRILRDPESQWIVGGKGFVVADGGDPDELLVY